MEKLHVTLDLLRYFATQFKAKIDILLNNKVDKVNGKQLSTEDYTTAEKQKLSGLENYTLPKASENTLGGVKIGAGLTIDTDGNLSATGGGEADSVNWNNVVGKPTNLSAFTNDSGYQTAENVNSKLADYAKKTDISNVYKYQGSVANYAALPTSNQKIGDVYNVETADSTHGIKAGDNVAWNGNAWDSLAGIFDTSSLATKTEVNVKVDKITGKGLSTNDFTNAYKNKLDELENVTIDFATNDDVDAIITEVFG